MAGWYEVDKSSDGQYYFVLKAGNAEVILTSERYTGRAGAENGIASVQKNSPDEANYERKTASDGRYHFNLKAANHQVIGTSELYSSESAMKDGIAAVKKAAPGAKLDDITK